MEINLQTGIAAYSASAKAPAKLKTFLTVVFKFKAPDASSIADTLVLISKEKALITPALDAFIDYAKAAKPEDVEKALKSKTVQNLKPVLASIAKTKTFAGTIAAIKKFKFKSPTVKTPTVKTPTVKTPTVKTPTVKTPTVKTPTVKTPTAEVRYPPFNLKAAMDKQYGKFTGTAYYDRPKDAFVGTVRFDGNQGVCVAILDRAGNMTYMWKTEDEALWKKLADQAKATGFHKKSTDSASIESFLTAFIRDYLELSMALQGKKFKVIFITARDLAEKQEGRALPTFSYIEAKNKTKALPGIKAKFPDIVCHVNGQLKQAYPYK